MLAKLVKTNLLTLFKFILMTIPSGIFVLGVLHFGPRLETVTFPVSGNFVLTDVSRSGDFLSFQLQYNKYRPECRFLYVAFFGDSKKSIPRYLPATVGDAQGNEVRVRNITLWLSKSTLDDIWLSMAYQCPLEPWFSMVKSPPLILDASVLAPAGK